MSENVPALPLQLPHIQIVDPPGDDKAHNAHLFYVATTWRACMNNILGQIAAYAQVRERPVIYIHGDGRIAHPPLLTAGETAGETTGDTATEADTVEAQRWWRTAQKMGEWYWQHLFFERATFLTTQQMADEFEAVWARLHQPRRVKGIAPQKEEDHATRE